MGVGAGLYMYDVVKKFSLAISSPDEFLSKHGICILGYSLASYLQLKAKFHYTIWSQTGPKLVADLLARAKFLLAAGL